MFTINPIIMNHKSEEKVASLRCDNKSVLFISKRLAMNTEKIERIISQWIIETDNFIKESVSGHKLQKIPDPNSVRQMIKAHPNLIPLEGEVLDYVAIHHSDHHDRIMDSIRFHILRSLEETK